MKQILRELRQWFREVGCDHWWRPARDGFHPAKVCEDCGKHMRLTESEFYSEFGVVFDIFNAHARPKPQ